MRTGTVYRRLGVASIVDFPIANWWTVASAAVVAILVALGAVLLHLRAGWRILLGVLALVVAGMAVGTGYRVAARLGLASSRRLRR